jgi:predicted kinase
MTRPPGTPAASPAPSSGTPLVYLLAGLTGSGKTTFAKTLEAAGVMRLSVDEEVFARHGRYGIDYPDNEYPAREHPIVQQIRQRIVELIQAGHSLVLDYGLWRRSEREDYKQLVERAGGRWQLLYFPVTRDELLRRLTERNRRQDPNALTVTTAALDEFIDRFEPPVNEGEEIIQPDPPSGRDNWTTTNPQLLTIAPTNCSDALWMRTNVAMGCSG